MSGPTLEQVRARCSINPDGCWEWTGSLTTKGYARIRLRSGWVRGNRYVWQLVHGPLSPTIDVLHRCDNRLCVNPNHLFLGSHDDNNKDRAAKGRSASGERNGATNHALDVEKVIAARSAFAAGATIRSLAIEYGVPTMTMSDCVHGRSWRFVPLATTVTAT